MCIHPAGWPFHAPTTASARAESWRRQVRDSQESKGKRMAYADCIPEPPPWQARVVLCDKALAGARRYDLREGLHVGNGPRGTAVAPPCGALSLARAAGWTCATGPWCSHGARTGGATRHRSVRASAERLSAHAPIPPFSLRVRRGRRSGTRRVGTPGAPVSAHSLCAGRRNGARTDGFLAVCAGPTALGPFICSENRQIHNSVCGRRLRPPRYVVVGGARW